MTNAIPLLCKLFELCFGGLSDERLAYKPQTVVALVLEESDLPWFWPKEGAPGQIYLERQEAIESRHGGLWSLLVWLTTGPRLTSAWPGYGLTCYFWFSSNHFTGLLMVQALFPISHHSSILPGLVWIPRPSQGLVYPSVLVGIRFDCNKQTKVTAVWTRETTSIFPRNSCEDSNEG
jgi:hypothetical protein